MCGAILGNGCFIGLMIVVSFCKTDNWSHTIWCWVSIQFFFKNCIFAWKEKLTKWYWNLYHFLPSIDVHFCRWFIFPIGFLSIYLGCPSWLFGFWFTWILIMISLNFLVILLTNFDVEIHFLYAGSGTVWSQMQKRRASLRQGRLATEFVGI